MPVSDRRRAPEDLARLGSEAFNRHVRPTLRPEDEGKFVAVDIETGDHEIDDDDYAAVTKLRKRQCGGLASDRPRKRFVGT